MNLAERLAEIMKAENKDALVAAFRQDIKGHKEESILSAALTYALAGWPFVDIGATLPPANLIREEGFHVETVGRGFHLVFAQ